MAEHLEYVRKSPIFAKERDENRDIVRVAVRSFEANVVILDTHAY